MSIRNSKNIKPGDWIRFYQSGRLVIGVVAYIQDDGWRAMAQTDIGACNLDDILEYRREESRV